MHDNEKTLVTHSFCMLTSLLYLLFTHDCVSLHNSILIKYANYTIVVVQISNNDESGYREVIRSLSAQCSTNNHTFSAMNTKSLWQTLQKSCRGGHLPIYINRTKVKACQRLLGVHIFKDLSWHHLVLIRRGQQHLYFIRRVKKYHLFSTITSLRGS